MARRLELVKLLADGQVHSGVALTDRLGTSRRALRADVAALGALGLEVQSVRGRGYRLTDPIELLDEATCLDALSAANRAKLQALEVHFEIDSTNRHLMEQARAGVTLPRVCLAEVQTAGRGRMGRSFVSPLGGNIYLSLACHADLAPPALLGLSPAIAVAFACLLEAEGAAGIGIKWPNDVYVDGKKLSGILLELGQGPDERSILVVGIGVNLRLSAAVTAQIDQPVTDLYTVLGRTPARNQIAGRLIDAILDLLGDYFETGFEPFRREYHRFDLLQGRDLIIERSDGTVNGRSLGLDPNGALLVEINGRATPIVSGDLRVRPAA